MVADLVGDHIGLGKIAGRAEPLAELVVEGEVDVELVVVRAVERPDRRRRRAATRRGLPAEEDERRRLVGLAHALEDRRPGILGIAEDRGDELALLVGGRARLAGFGPGPATAAARELEAATAAEEPGRVDAGKPRDRENHQDDADAAEAEAPATAARQPHARAAHAARQVESAAGAAVPAAILDIAAFASVLPAHVFVVPT